MFVWDESKRRKVIKEHKVDFALLLDVFDDAFGIYREDTEHSDDEIRYSVIGLTAEYGLVFTVFTYTDDEEVRLITARRAEKWMVKQYEER
jgi:uncharacterized DUF497 family protein